MRPGLSFHGGFQMASSNPKQEEVKRHRAGHEMPGDHQQGRLGGAGRRSSGGFFLPLPSGSSADPARSRPVCRGQG